MTPFTGYPKTQPVIQMRQTVHRRGDGLGVCRGMMLGVALWSIAAVVAVAIGSTGDARSTAEPHAAVTVDRGGQH